MVWSGSTPMRHNSIKRLAGAGAAGIYLTFITLIRQMVRIMEIYNILHKKQAERLKSRERRPEVDRLDGH